MKHLIMTRLSVVLSALVLSGTVAFAQMNPAPAATPARKLTTAIDPTATLSVIQGATFDDRETVLTGLEARMKAVDDILATVKLSDAGKDDAKKAAGTLTNTIRRSRDSTAEDWSKIRDELGENYSDYASTVIRVEHEASIADK